MGVLRKNQQMIELYSHYFSIILCVIFFLAVPGVYAVEKADTIAYQSYNPVITSSIREYRKKIDTINSEISFFKNNMQWLGLKIKRMNDFNRHVPEMMKKSMENKAHNIEALERVRNRLKRNLEALLEKKSADTVTALHGDEKVKKKSVPKVKKSNAAVKTGHVVLKQGDATQKKTDFSRALQRKIKENGLGDWVEIKSDGCCCRLVTRLPILFASGSAKIADTYKKFFKKLAVCIRDYDARVIVDGYADIDGIHNKTYPSNFELGAARAANIVHELVKHGVKPSVFRIGTTGKYRFKTRGMSKKKGVERRADLTVIFAA